MKKSIATMSATYWTIIVVVMIFSLFFQQFNTPPVWIAVGAAIGYVVALGIVAIS